MYKSEKSNFINYIFGHVVTLPDTFKDFRTLIDTSSYSDYASGKL